MSNIVWNNKEKRFIKENAALLSDEKIAGILEEMTGRAVSVQAVRKQRRKLGLIKKKGRGLCIVENNMLNEN